MTTRVPIVAAINDLSGVGRCSLAVTLPILSAMGVQACPAPTAVLSAHTGFSGIVSLDMTDFLDQTLKSWAGMALSFDCVYTGYLGAPRQAQSILLFMENRDALFVVDPVMGDEGRLYSGIDADMPRAMRALCERADVITPNLTEYSLLTGETYTARERTRAELTAMLRRLPARAAVITSVPFEGGLANAYRRADGVTGVIPFSHIGRHFPGTGDMFASVLTGALATGDALETAVTRAATYVLHTIRVSLSSMTDPNFGAQLERTIPLLAKGEI
ncbi:MAG: pyridoxamine kinase [Christensenellales bacterium]|jgi:pyridoxine kinase